MIMNHDDHGSGLQFLRRRRPPPPPPQSQAQKALPPSALLLFRVFSTFTFQVQRAQLLLEVQICVAAISLEHLLPDFH